MIVTEGEWKLRNGYEADVFSTEVVDHPELVFCGQVYNVTKTDTGKIHDYVDHLFWKQDGKHENNPEYDLIERIGDL